MSLNFMVTKPIFRLEKKPLAGGGHTLLSHNYNLGQEYKRRQHKQGCQRG